MKVVCSLSWSLLSVLLFFLLFSSVSAQDPYVESLTPVSFGVATMTAFVDHANDFVFALLSDGGVVKLNRTTYEVADQSSFRGSGLMHELYASDDWLFTYNTADFVRMKGSNLSDDVRLNLQVDAYFYDGIANVVLDASRQLAFAISFYGQALLIIDVESMEVTGSFQFASEVNKNNETGASAMTYDADRRVLWIGSDCAGSITSKVWQIDMSSIAGPRVLTVTEFGGTTCFYSDPIIDPQGSGIAYFSDNNANNVIAILPENGKWNSDLYLPLKSSSDMGVVDKERKQGFYLSKRECGSLQLFRFCFNDRPLSIKQVSYLEDTPKSPSGLYYDNVDQTLYLFFSDAIVFPLQINGTDCPQDPEYSSASTPTSLLRLWLSHFWSA